MKLIGLWEQLIGLEWRYKCSPWFDYKLQYSLEDQPFLISL